MKISAITIPERHRKDMGDLDSLARSIADVGLLHPVVVTPAGKLVAGARRLAACTLLGWTDIPATVVDNLRDAIDLLRAERDENTARKDFTPSEAVALSYDLEPLEREAAKDRIMYGGVENFPRQVDNKPQRALDHVAASMGMSRPTLEKARAVVEAAEEDPETFGPLLEKMDATGKVDPAWRSLQAAQRATETPELPAGKYNVIYADPPWAYNNSGFDQSAAQQYPTMTAEEIAALPIPDLCTEATVLFLWATSPLLPEALHVLDAWGFTYKAHLVWDKGRAPLLGWFVKTEHELLLIGTRAGNTHPQERPPSVLRFAPGRHSEKPAEVRRLIETMYAGPYIELFAREVVDGWDFWGNEV